MQTVKGTPFFCQTEEKIKDYPSINQDISCQILIVGGGIDGAIANYFLSQKYDCVLVEKNRLAKGTTSCASVLLEYQLDDFAHRLNCSEKLALALYKMGMEGIDTLAEFIARHGNLCHFSRRPSLIYSTSNKDVSALEKEYAFRRANRLSAELLNNNTNPFPFEMVRGLYSTDGGAECNAYLLAKQLFESAPNQDAIYQNTEVLSIEGQSHGYVATTPSGNISARYVVIATGCNFKGLDLARHCNRRVGYSIVTEPLDGFSWYGKALVEDCDNPCHYMRVLPDSRLLIGGCDTPYNGKISQVVAKRKYDKLLAYAKRTLAIVSDRLKTQYEFCGQVADTQNQLGLIGRTHSDGLYYFLSTGNNGVVNAIYGASLMLDILENRENPLEDYFSPLRFE